MKLIGLKGIGLKNDAVYLYDRFVMDDIEHRPRTHSVSHRNGINIIFACEFICDTIGVSRFDLDDDIKIKGRPSR